MDRKNLDQIIEYIIEGKVSDKLKNFLKQIGIEISSNRACKEILKKEKYMWLYHGTRSEYLPSIKKEGLKLSEFGRRCKEEGDIMLSYNGKSVLYFGNVYKPGKDVGFGGTGIGKGKQTVYVLAKLDTKFLKKSFAFVYFKDVPPENLVIEGTKEFDKIGKNSPCLIQR